LTEAWLAAFYATLVFSIGYALVRGSAPERLGAGVLIAMTVMQFTARAVIPPDFTIVYLVSLIVDAFGVVAFGMLAIYAKRVWPLWATSLQILSLTAHFAQEVGDTSNIGTYIVMKGAPTFLAILALLAGAIAHRRRLRCYGTDPAWKAW
jgi:hypothetical protein